jgi:hypothetical protein
MTSQSVGMFVEKTTVNAMWELFDSNGTNTQRGGGGGGDATQSGMSNSTWTYAVGSITGTTGTACVQASCTSSTVSAFTDSSTQLNVADYDGSGSGLFLGTLDEVRVSNNARSQSYITATYNQTKPSQTMVSVGTIH